MIMRERCYWRFKGEKVYHYGYPTPIQGVGLVRMGLYNGDESNGPVVDPEEIEEKK